MDLVIIPLKLCQHRGTEQNTIHLAYGLAFKPKR